MSQNSCTECKSIDMKSDPHQDTLFCLTCGFVQNSGAIIQSLYDDVCNNYLYDTTEFTKDYLVETNKSQELQSKTNHQTQDQVALDKLKDAEFVDCYKKLNLGAKNSQTISVDSNSHKCKAVLFQKTKPIHDTDKNEAN